MDHKKKAMIEHQVVQLESALGDTKQIERLQLTAGHTKGVQRDAPRGGKEEKKEEEEQEEEKRRRKKDHGQNREDRIQTSSWPE